MRDTLEREDLRQSRSRRGMKAIKARTLEEAFDLSPDECVVEPQYKVELVPLP